MDTALRCLVVAALGSGCGASVTVAGPQADSGAAPVDVGVTILDAGAAPADVGVAPLDVGVTALDVGATVFDAGTPRRDVPTTTPVDVPVATRDVATVDRPVARDIPTVSPSSLTGTWRAVRYESPGPADGTVVLTDADTLFPGPDGTETPFRVNGVMSLSETRLALTLGTVSGGHFYPYAGVDGDTTWSGVGYTIPGLLSVDGAGAVFEVPGGDAAFVFERTADDALVLVDRDSATRVTFVRDPSPATLDRLNLFGLVFRGGVTVASPRAALRWDLPGAAVVRTADTELGFSPMGYTPVPVTMPGPPPAELVAPVGGVSIAVAYLEPYSDLNRNGRFDADVDRVVGSWSFGVAWRGPEAPTAEFARSPFADLVPGWQVVHLHRDYVTGAWAATPFDNTHAPSPDASLERIGTTEAIELR